MPQKYTNVIIFGATGDVGRSAALEAQKRGAKVHLAMRDTSKSINPELDNSQNFSRIKADLSDPSSVKKAVEATSANAAFIYRVKASEDVYGASLRALKDAGVSWTVFLSSFTIRHDQDIRTVDKSDFIPYIHATIEAQLEDAGMPHAALRPGAFASNSIRHNLDRSKSPPEAEVINATRQADLIVPQDIGRVGGAVLVNRPGDSDKEIIYLFGPQLISADETWDIIREICPGGKDVKILHPSFEELVASTMKKGFPEATARSVIEHQRRNNTEKYYSKELYETGVANIKKFSGYEPTAFKDYIVTQKV